MSVVSLQFLCFVILVAALYQVCPAKYRWCILFGGSMFFVFSSQSISMVLVMAAQVLLTYGCGLAIGSCSTEETGKRRAFMLTGLLANLLVLIVLKDSSFFVHHPVDLPAPMGISYYTLILVGYILDIYWGMVEPQKNPAKMALFSAYFPMMTSGPITRYRDLKETLYLGTPITYQSMTFGLQRILWGMFKKLVVASRLGIYVDAVYGDPARYGGVYLLVAFPAFVMQLYTDFSGCIDIIMGVSEMFGVVLPENFQTPFFSTTISEFWRRWHITIGAWLKDYVMYPLLKSRPMQNLGKWSKKKFGKKTGKKIPTFVGLLVTWFLIGFWHGGAWNYIWGSGLYYGILIILAQLCEPMLKDLTKKLHIDTEAFSWTCFCRIRTFCIFTVGLSFFRSYDGLMNGLYRWKQALTVLNPWVLVDGSLLELGLNGSDYVLIAISFLVMMIVGIAQQKGSAREQLAKQNLPLRWVILIALLFAVLIFGQYGTAYDAASFIYEKF